MMRRLMMRRQMMRWTNDARNNGARTIKRPKMVRFGALYNVAKMRAADPYLRNWLCISFAPFESLRLLRTSSPITRKDAKKQRAQRSKCNQKE